MTLSLANWTVPWEFKKRESVRGESSRAESCSGLMVAPCSEIEGRGMSLLLAIPARTQFTPQTGKRRSSSNYDLLAVPLLQCRRSNQLHPSYEIPAVLPGGRPLAVTK